MGSIRVYNITVVDSAGKTLLEYSMLAPGHSAQGTAEMIAAELRDVVIGGVVIAEGHNEQIVVGIDSNAEEALDEILRDHYGEKK